MRRKIGDNVVLAEGTSFIILNSADREQVGAAFRDHRPLEDAQMTTKRKKRADRPLFSICFMLWATRAL